MTNLLKILRADHWVQVSVLIRSQINHFDVYQTYDPGYDWEGDEGDKEDVNGEDAPNSNVSPPQHVSSSPSTFWSDNHFILGSFQGVWTIQSLLEENEADVAFASFCAHLSVTIKDLSPADVVVIGESQKVHHYCKFAETYANYSCLGWGIPVPKGILRINGRPEHTARSFAL